MTNFHDLYSRYAQDVYRFSVWLSGDSEEAKDITSETFVRAWTAYGNVKMETVKAYLFTIARNVFLQRERRTRRQVPLDSSMPDPTPGPDQIAEQRSDIQAVLTALQELAEIDRAALIMRVQDELPYEEIARSLGISLPAAKVKVHRARLKLASLISR